MKAQKYFGVLVILALLFALVPAGSVSAAVTKVAVCHLDDMGVYHLINISEMAFPAHVEHGDASPLEWVPGMEGYKFNADCSLNAIPQKTLVDTVFVPGSNLTKTGPAIVSSDALSLGVDYELIASGTYRYGTWIGSGIADARCSLRPANSQYNPLPVPAWFDGANFGGSWDNYLQVWVNGAAVEWGTGCDMSNVYSKLLTGSGNSLTFTILDSGYSDNSGGITVDIYQVNW